MDANRMTISSASIVDDDNSKNNNGDVIPKPTEEPMITGTLHHRRCNDDDDDNDDIRRNTINTAQQEQQLLLPLPSPPVVDVEDINDSNNHRHHSYTNTSSSSSCSTKKQIILLQHDNADNVISLSNPSQPLLVPWEERIQLEIDATQQVIDQILLGTTTTTTTTTSGSRHNHNNSKNEKNEQQTSSTTANHDVAQLHDWKDDDDDDRTTRLFRLDTDDVLTMTPATTIGTTTTTTATSTTIAAATTITNSIREHRRLSSILDQSPSIDIECNHSGRSSSSSCCMVDMDNRTTTTNINNKNNKDEHGNDDTNNNSNNHNTALTQAATEQQQQPLPVEQEEVQATNGGTTNSRISGSILHSSEKLHHRHHHHHPRRHLVAENDDTGEGLNVVITIGKLSSRSSSSSLHQLNHNSTNGSNESPHRHRRHSSESSFNHLNIRNHNHDGSSNPLFMSILPVQQNVRNENIINDQLIHKQLVLIHDNNDDDNDVTLMSAITSKDVVGTHVPTPLVGDMQQMSIETTTVTNMNVAVVLEEKKEHDETMDIRHARFTSTQQQRRRQVVDEEDNVSSNNNHIMDENDDDHELLRDDCLSVTESEVASLDGLPSTLQHRLLELGTSPRERILQTLDGIFSSPPPTTTSGGGKKHSETIDTFKNMKATNGRRSFGDDEEFGYSRTQNFTTAKSRRSRVVISGGKVPHETSNDEDNVNDNTAPSCGGIFIDTCMNNFTGLWNGTVMDDDRLKCGSKGQWDTTTMKQNLEVPLAILDCSNIIHQQDRTAPSSQAPQVHSSFVRVARDNYKINPTYGETLIPAEADPRMQDWIANQYLSRDNPPNDGTFQLGQSRTVIVHEINRGNWTWCTAWSPNGMYLAVATDNHQLAVVDTVSSSVWRVRHDRKQKNPLGSNTTRSIRTIDWGSQYIAIGGTGNVVSILSPVDPYDILHDIPSTGFVGSVHWRGDSNVLAIGSRLDFVMIVRINESDENSLLLSSKKVHSEILHKIEYKYWVNCVRFSADGSCMAVGDAGGIVSVYDYEESKGKVETHMITWFKRKDSILSIEWSPDGKWLYAGGEDCSVTVVDTSYWEIVHRIGQDRWVQCITSSYGGSHVAIGGVSSEISILDVENGWDSVMGVELKGLVPLSARWHPRDQYLVLTGQDNSILVVETTNARHVKGHHLHSISPIRAIEFSPDGRMAIVGNEAGVVTFYSLSGTSFITAYELVIPLSKSINVQWSLNGTFIVIGCASSVIIVSRKRNKRQGHKCPPNASGFSVKKVIGDAGSVHAIAIDYQSQYVAASGDCTRILDVRDDFSIVHEWKSGPCYANTWSPDGRWLAMMGKDKFLTIYDTSSKRVDRWRVIFSMKCDFIGRAIAWGPLIVGGLLYLAYGGDSNDIYIMEIRTNEGTWETVLKVKRDATINALDWSMEGLLAAGVGNGTVCIVDLAYLQSGIAVNEMDYEWQRQALTCYTEIRRNRGINSIKSLRWLPAAPGSDRLLAVGGTDGEVEIIDLTEQQRCKGYAR